MSVQEATDYSKLEPLQLSRLVCTRFLRIPELSEEQMAKHADAIWKAQPRGERLVPRLEMDGHRFRAKRIWDAERRAWAIYAEQDFPHVASDPGAALHLAGILQIAGHHWEIRLHNGGARVELHGPSKAHPGRVAQIGFGSAQTLPAAICIALLKALDSQGVPG